MNNDRYESYRYTITGKQVIIDPESIWKYLEKRNEWQGEVYALAVVKALL